MNLNSLNIGLFQKKSKRGGILLWAPTLEFLGFLFYPWKFQTKQSFIHHQKLHKIVLHHLEILRAKTKTPGYSAWFFLNYPWKFHVVFNYLMEIPLAISSVPLEIPYPKPPFIKNILLQHNQKHFPGWCLKKQLHHVISSCPRTAFSEHLESKCW